jgi:hypothetical protein
MSEDEPCYLYGFLRPPAAPLPELVGVFGARVQLQVDGDLAALVSPVPRGAQRATRSDVLAHSEVLQALLPDHDIVPAAFGTVYPEGLDVAALPRGERRALSRLVDELSDRVEVQVRATYDEAGATATIVDGDARLRRMRARKQDYSTQLAIGTRFAELLDRQRRSDTTTAAKRLSRIAERVAVDTPQGEWGAFRLSLLVQRRKLDDLERALAAMADEAGSHLTIDWVGPLPPYSFVQPAAKRRAG